MKKLLFGVLLLSLALAACGGGGSSGDDPTSTVKDLVKAVEGLDFEKAREYMCEEHKGSLPDIKEGFAELEELGIDAQELLDAFDVTLSDMKYEEKSKSDDKAVVHVSGQMSMEVDMDKIRPIMKKAIETALGMEVTDEMLDSMMEGEFSAETMNQEASMDDDINLVKEDGKWRVCDDLGFLDDLDTGF